MLKLIDYILIAVIALLIVLDVWYLRRKGKSCSGCASCPYAGSCAKLRDSTRKQKPPHR